MGCPECSQCLKNEQSVICCIQYVTAARMRELFTELSTETVEQCIIDALTAQSHRAWSLRHELDETVTEFSS